MLSSHSIPVAFVCASLMALALLGSTPNQARADDQWSSRLALGGGLTLGDQHHEGLFESALRAEVLFGRPGDEHPRIGIATELTQFDFNRASAGFGLGFLIPTWRGYPIVLTALGGYSFRPGSNGFVGIGTLAWGYRGYNFHSRYGLGLQGYVSMRMNLDEPQIRQITFGIEIDLEFLFVIPVLAIRNLVHRGDPDEPNL